MAVLNEVIKSLEVCKSTEPSCTECPYKKIHKECLDVMHNDAIDILKLQAKIINRLQKDVADLRDALSMTD